MKNFFKRLFFCNKHTYWGTIFTKNTMTGIRTERAVYTVTDFDGKVVQVYTLMMDEWGLMGKVYLEPEAFIRDKKAIVIG